MEGDQPTAVARRWTAALAFLFLFAALVPSTTADSTGVFAPPHADTGVDTNGDRLFNYLLIDASLEVLSAGTFMVRVVLKDPLDLATVAEASTTAALATGARQVSVLLPGADIYNGGWEGTYAYYAHMTLVSEGGATLDADVHRTQSYSLNSFQPYSARFVPPTSDRTLDNDTDGLVDWLDLEFTIDVATDDTYTLSSHLTDTTYAVSLVVSQRLRLPPGRTTLHQLFLAYPLRLAQRGGPYLVANTLYDARDLRVDFLFVKTAAYDYMSFEGPPVRLRPPHADTGEDPDGDGLFNALRIDVGLDSESSGTYTLRGRLRGGGGQLIQETVARLSLGKGMAQASLSFQGSAVYAAGVDGPYRVELEVYDPSLRLLDAGTHSTAAYSYLSFEPRILNLDPSPPEPDRGVDFDGDGKFDVLRLSVRVQVSVTATVRFNASLRGGVFTAELARTSKSLVVTPGQHDLFLDFAGLDLVSAGVDGPYRAWIYIYDMQGTLIDAGNVRTAAYNASDFEAAGPRRILGVLGDAAEDGDGDGLFNRLRLRLQVEVAEPGRYRLDGSLFAGTTWITSSASSWVLVGGSASLDVVFAGPDIRASGLDGPYLVSLSFWLAGAWMPLDAAIVGTATYQAATFAPAIPATLSGSVVDDLLGESLSGARVWAIDYANHVSREAVTDALGRYSLPAFAGRYWVIVDHPAGQAEAWPMTLEGNVTSHFSLGLPRRLIVEAELTWTGWDRVLMGVRYVYARDAPAFRFILDWDLGNRDGVVQPWESALAEQASDRMREVVDEGSSSGRLMVNTAGYVAVGAPLWTDRISGAVDLLSTPTVGVTRPFASAWTIGTPSRIVVSLETYHDTVLVQHRLWLRTPGSYRYAFANAAEEVLILARFIPYFVNPGLPPGGAEPAPMALVEMTLFQTGGGSMTPSAPTGLAASLAGSIVTLTWFRTRTNLDGTRNVNLAGYQVYRRTSTSEPFARINDRLVTSESFEDKPGIGTFAYVVSAINTDGVEGPLSASVNVTIGSLQSTVAVQVGAGAGVLGLWPFPPMAAAVLATAILIRRRRAHGRTRRRRRQAGKRGMRED